MTCFIENRPMLMCSVIKIWLFGDFFSPITSNLTKEIEVYKSSLLNIVKIKSVVIIT